MFFSEADFLTKVRDAKTEWEESASNRITNIKMSLQLHKNAEAKTQLDAFVNDNLNSISNKKSPFSESISNYDLSFLISTFGYRTLLDAKKFVASQLTKSELLHHLHTRKRKVGAQEAKLRVGVQVYDSSLETLSRNGFNFQISKFMNPDFAKDGKFLVCFCVSTKTCSEFEFEADFSVPLFCVLLD